MGGEEPCPVSNTLPLVSVRDRVPAPGAALVSGAGRVLIVQPRPGIGDLIWHLPLIHALAGRGQVDLLTKRSTGADALLADDPAIGRVMWLDRNQPAGRGRHDGPAGSLRLVADLRALKAGASVLLHQSVSLAACLAAARIPQRYGYGYGRQSWLLNRTPFLTKADASTHPTHQAAAYAAALGLGPLPDEAQVAVSIEAETAFLSRQGAVPGWAVLGIGSTEAGRCWPASRFANLAATLLARGIDGIVLLASESERDLADAILAQCGDSSRILRAIGWPLAEVAALLRHTRLFIGNDSGMLNLRVAVGGTAFGLFGVSGPLTHSARIVPIVSEAGPRAGMTSITLEDAIHALEAHAAL